MVDPARTGERDLNRHIIDFGLELQDLGPRIPVERDPAPRRDLKLVWPDGLAPTPTELPVEPATDEPLPRADVLVITWTIAEMLALADVLTPKVNPRTRWYRYDRKFEEYLPFIRKGAPSRFAMRLGSWYPTKVGTRKVICFKSELHLNQDGIRTDVGKATLPVADLFRQLIAEVKPKKVITVGTAGGVFPDHDLGDTVITRAAKFRLSSEFRNEDFANSAFRSKGTIPKKHLETAEKMIAKFADQLIEPDFGVPTTRYDLPENLAGTRNKPDIKVEGKDFPTHHPILTTDFFEFGTSTNGLEDEGCGVEMGDAVLGMVCDELGDDAPSWLVVRNASDPQINGNLPLEPVNMQTHWAVFYYEEYGYWTSVCSAIATWAMLAP